MQLAGLHVLACRGVAVGLRRLQHAGLRVLAHRAVAVGLRRLQHFLSHRVATAARQFGHLDLVHVPHLLPNVCERDAVLAALATPTLRARFLSYSQPPRGPTA